MVKPNSEPQPTRSGTLPRMKLSEFARANNIEYGVAYKHWQLGRDVNAATPNARVLADFTQWLREQKQIVPEVDYPGVELSVIYELYRHEYAPSRGLRGNQRDTGTILVSGWRADEAAETEDEPEGES